MLQIPCYRHKLILFLALALCSLIASAEISPSFQVRTIDVSPYGIKSENTKSGIYYDVANHLIKDLLISKHTPLNHKIYPYARIIHELKNGKTDLSILFKYKELENHVHYIAPLPTLSNIVIGLKGTQFKTINELEGQTIAYLRGAKFSNLIDDNPKILKITTKDFEQGIEMLAAHRVDAVIGPLDPIMAATIELNYPANFLGEPLTVSTRTPWIQISKKSPFIHIIDQLKIRFSQMLNDGEFKAIQKRYLTHSRHFIE